jgi:hypothetical protein
MKLSLEALKERAEAVASDGLLSSISGGTENACHDTWTDPDDERKKGGAVKDRLDPNRPPYN